MSTLTTIVLSIAAETTTPRRSWRRPRSCSGFGEPRDRLALAGFSRFGFECFWRCARERFVFGFGPRVDGGASSARRPAGLGSARGGAAPRRGLLGGGSSATGSWLGSLGSAGSSSATGSSAAGSSATAPRRAPRPRARRLGLARRRLARRQAPRSPALGTARRRPAPRPRRLSSAAPRLGRLRLGSVSSSRRRLGSLRPWSLVSLFVVSLRRPACCLALVADGQDARDLALRQPQPRACSRARRSPTGTAG